MSDSVRGRHDVENEELLEGQLLFKGPRKIRENLLGMGGDSSDSD